MSGLVRLLTAPAIELASLVSDTAAVLRREARYRDVPAVGANPGLVAEAFLDGGFSLLLSLLVGMPEPRQVRRGHEELLAMRDWLDERGWYSDPAGYHRSPPPLRSPALHRRSAMGLAGAFAYLEVAFESEYEPHPGEPGRERWLAHDENARAVAYVLEHPGEDRPWLVCTHGFSMGQPASNAQGLSANWLHAELGLNVLMPVLPLHGPRSSTRFSGGGLLQPDFVNVLHMFSQAVWDLRRLVGWVRRRSTAPLGLYGLSLGGYAVALASAFIEDLACVVAGVPAVDFTALARDNEPWAHQAYGRELRPDWRLVREVMYPVSPLSFEPLLKRERRYVYAGVADRIARPDQARALWRHWGKPEIEWLASGHVMAAMKPALRPFLTRVVADCLPGSSASRETPRPAAAVGSA